MDLRYTISLMESRRYRLAQRRPFSQVDTHGRLPDVAPNLTGLPKAEDEN